MIEGTLFFVHYALLLLFGIMLSVSYAGVELSFRKNIVITFLLFAVCGTLQIILYLLLDEALVWKLYPLIVHLPVVFLLCLYYHKKIITALASVSSAYLCCQPAKWIGLLCKHITQSYIAEQIARIVTLFLVGFIALRYIAPSLLRLFNKDFRSVCVLGMIPMFYYLFDYSTGIYTDLLITSNRVTTEFLPFFLCAAFLLFCIVYYKEYEQKAEAERNEQLIRVIVEQQTKEINAVKRSEHEIRLLRHDMRLLLNSIAVCIENNDLKQAKEMIASYSTHIDGTKLERFCNIDVINYVLSDFSAKCAAKHTDFVYTIEIEEIKADELMFSSILANALENALNAQEFLPEEKRSIRLMIKNRDEKLLLSVKNPTHRIPVFVDGLPISLHKGHGYGTQSIRYMTERLGGNWQFSVQDHVFITRVVI